MPAPLIPAAISLATKVLPLVLGAGQAIGGIAARGRANQLAPPAQDPRISEFLNEVRARRRTFETGAAFNPIIQQLRQREQGALQATSARARTLGEFLTVAGRFRGETTRGLTQVFASGQQLANQLFQQEGQIIGEQSQRELELQLLEQSRQEARAATRFQSAGVNALGFSARIGGGQENIGQPITDPNRTVPLSQAGSQAGQQFIARLDQPPLGALGAGQAGVLPGDPSQLPFQGIAPGGVQGLPTQPSPGGVINQILLGQGNRVNAAGVLGF